MTITARGIIKRFGHRTVLDDVDLDVQRGECVAIVGENGAGKSTFLRILASLIRPNAGTVTIDGRLGFCPQQAGLFELLTADEHLILFGQADGLDRRSALDQGRAHLASLGFVDTGAQARHLSGGSRQKLNLTLALLGRRDVLLLDEPYQGFDHGTYVNFWDHVDTWRAENKAIVVVTHMLAELSRVDRVVSL